MSVANPAQCLEKSVAGRVKTSLALNRLDNEGGDIVGRDSHFKKRFQSGQGVVLADPVIRNGERCVKDFTGKRPERVLVRGYFAGETHGQQGTAVKAAVECNDAASAGIGARDFYGVLDRFRTRREKHRLLRRAPRRKSVEFFREFDRGGVGSHHYAGVREPVQLRGNGFLDPGMYMTRVAHRDAARKVDVSLTFDVPYLRTFGARRKYGRQMTLSASHCASFPGGPIRVGNRRLE